jgi:hypothetical protein
MNSGNSGSASPGSAGQSGAGDTLIDPTLVSSNPGSYEDLHKKTKGELFSKNTPEIQFKITS